MKIAEIKADLLRITFERPKGGSGSSGVEVIYVEVKAEDGMIGTGFTYTLAGGGESVKALIDYTLQGRLVGRQLWEWSRLWEEMWEVTHRLGRGVSLLAISALDIAVWDLRAKQAGLPLYRFIGAQREKVPVYGSGRATHDMSLEELVAGSLSYVAEGYGAVKVRVGKRGAEEDVKRVKAVREALGPEVRLMVDCNERLDYPTALWLGKQLADVGVYWMEEPLASDDLASYRKLAQNLSIPIAIGEHLQGRFEFANVIREGAAAVLQPDAPLVGGVTEWLRIANLADAFGLPVSPHFLPELHIHLAAASKNCINVEHFPLIDDLLEESLQAEEGFMAPSQRPGHGIRWNPSALEKFCVKM